MEFNDNAKGDKQSFERVTHSIQGILANDATMMTPFVDELVDSVHSSSIAVKQLAMDLKNVILPLVDDSEGEFATPRVTTTHLTEACFELPPGLPQPPRALPAVAVDSDNTRKRRWEAT